MSCLVSSILLITLSATLITSPSRPQEDQQRLKVALVPFNIRGIPAKIKKAEAENSVTSCWVEYSIANVGTEPILEVYLTIFIADSTGRVIDVNNTSSTEKIDAGLTIVDRIRLPEKVKKSMTAFVTVNRAVTPSGLWAVDDADLASAVKTKLSKQTAANPNVTFQSHAVTTEADRIEIFELILRDILQDKKKSEILKDPSKLILLRESASFNLPDNLPARLVAMDKDEIRALAAIEGRIAYLIYDPLTSEGSEVGATIQLRSSYLPQPPNPIRLTSGYAFSFVCVKEKGHWVIRKSDGFALSVAGLLPAHD